MTIPEIATERLLLGALHPGDAAALCAYRSDPEVLRFQSWAPASVDEAVRFIEDVQSVGFDVPGTWCQLAIRRKPSGPLVGDLGVRFPADDPRQVEIGFTVAPPHQGRGFGTEAVRALVGHLLGPARKHRVFASVDPGNAASLALLERIGMRREAHFRRSLWFRGAWVDDVVYAVLESEWVERSR